MLWQLISPVFFFFSMQGVINQLSEQISSLNDRMDEFTTRVEELNSKLTIKRSTSSQQNLAFRAESCNGSASTSYFINGLGNGSIISNSSSSSQLAKGSPLMEEVLWLCSLFKFLVHKKSRIARVTIQSRSLTIGVETFNIHFEPWKS